MYIDIHKRNLRKKKLRRRRRQKRKKMKTLATVHSFFTIDTDTYKDKGITVFDFDDSRSNDFIANFVIPFRQSYVSDELLKSEVDNGINTREVAISNRLPELPRLKSGEFGEILVFFLSQMFVCPDSNIRPIKWRWKETKDQPCHLTDIVLMKYETDNPQPTDYIFSSEVKTSAKRIGERTSVSKMNEAIDGALKDKNSRIGKMIAYLTTQYMRDRNPEMAKVVKRFGDSTTISYERRISAIVVSERDSLKNHIKNITTDNMKMAINEQIALFAIPIKNLKSIYEELYTISPTKG